MEATVITEVNMDASLQRAQFQAIAGSCPDSHQSVLTGFRNYLKYARAVLGPDAALLPPTVDLLLGWTLMFRAKGRFVPGAASNGAPFGLMAKSLYQS